MNQYRGSGIPYQRARARVLREMQGQGVGQATLDEAERVTRQRRQAAGIAARRETMQAKRTSRDEQLERAATVVGTSTVPPQLYTPTDPQNFGLPTWHFQVTYRDPASDEVVTRSIFIPQIAGMSDRYIKARMAAALAGPRTADHYERVVALLNAIDAGTVTGPL